MKSALCAATLLMSACMTLDAVTLGALPNAHERDAGSEPDAAAPELVDASASAADAARTTSVPDASRDARSEDAELTDEEEDESEFP